MTHLPDDMTDGEKRYVARWRKAGEIFGECLTYAVVILLVYSVSFLF